MDLTMDEIRTMLGICYRGLRHWRDKTEELTPKDQDWLFNIGERIEEAYTDLYPFAPDVGDVPNDKSEEDSPDEDA